MKKRYTLVLLPLLGLVSCNRGNAGSTKSSPSLTNSSVSASTKSNTASSSKTPSVSPSIKEPRSIDDMIEDLKKPMTVTGTVTETLINTKDNTEKSLVNQESLILGNESYHIEISGESYDEPYTSTLYKGEDGKAVHYYLNDMNEVESEDATDSDGKTIAFESVSNPWDEIDPAIFQQEEDGRWVGDLENTDYYSDLNLIMDRNTNMDFTSMAEHYESLGVIYTKYELKIQDEKITGLIVETKPLSDALSTSRLSYDLDFDYSSSSSHEYPKLQPLETKPYHTALRNALTKLTTDSFAYSGSYTAYGDETEISGSFTDEGIYVYDSYSTPSTGNYGFIEKDGKVVFVTKDSKGNYKYKNWDSEQPYDARTYLDVTSLKDFRPQIVLASELFSYDETTKIYSLSGSKAGIFGKYFNLESQVDPATIQTATKLEIQLAENGNLKTMKYIGDGLGFDSMTIEYSFDSVTLPFEPTSLGEYDALKDFYGTYTGTIKVNNVDTELTIVFSSDGLTFNGTEATNVALNKYGELTFTVDETNYYIPSTKDRLKNADNYKTVATLTFTA